jgi:hypothetical protein
MDAYELAEQAEGLAYEIPADWSSGEPKNVATDIADMLRQQADRIAELEKDFKPVAWTNQKWLDGIAKEPQLFQPLFVHGKQTEHNTIPLYTTPQIKELSDEEIQSIWNEGIVGWYATQEESVLKFARAILKKASEK